MMGAVAARREGGTWPLWLLVAVAGLQVLVLAQVTDLRARVVQLEAGAEFQEYGQGCAVPETGQGVELPPVSGGKGLEV